MKRIIRFHADWCIPCKISEPAWKAFKEKHASEGYSFEDVNVDKDIDEAAKFGISSVPTVVLADNYNIQAIHIGSFTQEVLEKTFIK